MPDNILGLINKFDVFLFDIYGVIWNGKAPIVGATEVMTAIRKAGKKVVLLSNGTERQEKAELSNAKRGFIKGVHYDKIITSGELAYTVFSEDERKLKFYQFGRRNETLFADSKYIEEEKFSANVDFVYVGVPQLLENEKWKDCLTTSPFEKELQSYKKCSVPLVCANPDMKAHASQYDEAVIRQGSIARYYQDIGGDVEFFGKPYPQIYDFALQDINVPNDRILMIGDTLETDILGGNSYGIKTALMLTGITYENMQSEGFSSIEEYCAELKIYPNYIFETL